MMVMGFEDRKVFFYHRSDSRIEKGAVRVARFSSNQMHKPLLHLNVRILL